MSDIELREINDSREDIEITRAFEIYNNAIAKLMSYIENEETYPNNLSVMISSDMLKRLPIRTESIKRVPNIIGIRVKEGDIDKGIYTVVAIADNGDTSTHKIYLSDLIHLIDKGSILSYIDCDIWNKDDIPF